MRREAEARAHRRGGNGVFGAWLTARLLYAGDEFKLWGKSHKGESYEMGCFGRRRDRF